MRAHARNDYQARGPRNAVVLDPHDGRCNGVHNIEVVGFPTADGPDDVLYATLTWGPNGPLSINGSQSFARALDTALVLAEYMRLHGAVPQVVIDEVMKKFRRPE